MALDIADAALRLSLRSNAKLRLDRDVQGWLDPLDTAGRHQGRAGNYVVIYILSSDGKARLSECQDDAPTTTPATSASSLSLPRP